MSTIDVTGHLSRADFATSPGTPRKNQLMSIIYSQAISRVTYACVCGGGPVVVNYDNQYSVLQTTTDCNGDFAFSVPIDVNHMDLYIGGIIVNPAWTGGNCTDICSSISQFLIFDPASDPRGNSGGISVIPVTGTSPLSGSPADNAWFQNGTGLATLHGASGVVFGQVNELAITANPSVLNIQMGGTGTSQVGTIRVLVKKGVDYYTVNNASITLTDTCGASNTFTGGALGFGGPTWTDWVGWNSMTINSGIPPDCSYATNANLTLFTSLPLTSVDYVTTSNTLPTITKPYHQDFRWFIILQDCTSTPIPGQMADAQNGVIAFIWNNSSGAIKFARHLSPSANIGTGTTGWETTQTFADTGDHVGMCFIEDVTLCADFTTITGTPSPMFKKNTSSGLSGQWNTATSSTASGAQAVARSTLKYATKVIGNLTTGSLVMYKDFIQDGTFTIPSSNITTSSTTTLRCGLAFLGDKYGCLYNTNSTTILFSTSTNATTWSSTSTSLIDQVASMVKTLGSNSLVGLTWNSTAKQCKAVRSYDSGTTWEQDTSYISVIPTLDVPPTLVPMQDGVYAVWQVSDAPNFAYSGDAGKTWT